MGLFSCFVLGFIWFFVYYYFIIDVYCYYNYYRVCVSKLIWESCDALTGIDHKSTEHEADDLHLN